MLQIGGFQKLSLVDFPETISSIVFTQGCVFRCGYCHNPDLIPFSGTIIDEQEVFEYLSKNKKMIEGVCVTGGEPTLQKDLIPFLEKIKEQGLKIKLDTNGIRPDVMKKIFEEKLTDYVAMDVKAPWEKYDKVIQSALKDATERCKETFHIIQESEVEHEFRTTLHPEIHERDDFFAMARECLDGEKYFLQNMCAKKTLDAAISQEKKFSLEELMSELRVMFPRLHIDVR